MMAVKIQKGKEDDGGFIFRKAHITKRELKVLALMADGVENGEAAKKLNINVKTLANHQYNVMKKLGARTRTHAVTIAVQQGMLVTERDQAFGKSRSKYLWCLHCERTYENGQFRTVKIKPFIVDHVRYAPEFEMCPYEDCDGDAVIDAWEWEHVRENHPDYPKVPKKGKVYPLYE